jgi:hypothetical protein
MGKDAGKTKPEKAECGSACFLELKPKVKCRKSRLTCVFTPALQEKQCGSPEM